MRILKISAGLSPKRSGGVPAYVAEVREELSHRGHHVAYLDTDYQDESRKARIVRSNSAADDFAFYNSGAQPPWGKFRCSPLSDIRATKQTAECLLQFVEREKPDCIHFHELICFPMELVSRLKSSGWKLIFTPQDYFGICPAVKLFLPSLNTCTLEVNDLQCHRCIRHFAPGRVSPYYRRYRSFIDEFPLPAAGAFLRKIDTFLGRIIRPFVETAGPYKARRVAAIKHLESFDRILCMSKAQEQLLRNAVGPLRNIHQTYLARKTYGDPAVVLRSHAAEERLRFVALNVFEATKGLDILLREFSELRKEFSSVELHIYGGADPGQLGVVWHKAYSSADLNSIAAISDVLIIPSIWEETYGYVGPEMLTRGVPLIVSSAGGMKEYVIHGYNGLIFEPRLPGSLKECMKSVATQTELLTRLKANAPLSQKGIATFEQHVNELEYIYSEVCASK